MSFACPISFQTLDENQVRFQAAAVTAVALLFVFTGWDALLLLLAYDFAVRIASLSKLSPIWHMAKGMVTMCRLTPIKTDAAPKHFAARVGLAFSVIAWVLHAGGFESTAFYLIAVLAVCAFFEAALNFCVGCWFYALLNRLNLTIIDLKE